MELRGALIGFGTIAAKAHLPAWQSLGDVAIVAAADTSAAGREAFLQARPDGRWYESVEDLLAAERLDFVDICTPPASHAALIQRALDARLHVLCEKPLVTRAADALAVAAAAEAAGRVVHTVHNWLEAPVCARISALVAEGAIGAVRSLRWRTLRPAAAAGVDSGGENWRLDPAIAGGGILFDHGWHALYCVMRWAGGSPRGVAASLEARRRPASPLEDTATLALDFARCRGDIYLTWTADRRANEIDIWGERGRIHVDGDTVLLEGEIGERRWRCPPALTEGSYRPDLFAPVVQNFCAAARGSAPGNLEEAMLCMQLIDLAQRSSSAGGARLPIGAQRPDGGAAPSRQARTTSRRKKVGAPTAVNTRNQPTLPASAKASTR
jgi:predicted dehydrogenase